MGTINLINGGLDVLTIVDSLIAVERQPITRLQQQAKNYQDRVSAYQTLNAKLLAFRTSVESLLYKDEEVPLNLPADYSDRFGTSLLALRSAESSDEAVATASAGKGTAVGNFTVTVTRMAKFNAHASNNFASDTETATRTGTLVIQKGTEAEATITIDETNNTLQGIKNAINGANAGFTAAILNDGSGTPYRLVVTSDDSGTANELAITNNLTGGGGAAVTFTETTPAEDAALEINGVDVQSSSNTITNALEGVTLTLRSESGTTVIRVDRDTDAIAAGLKDLVAGYNDLMAYISSQSRYDTSRKSSGILAGDFTLRDAQSRLGSVLFQSVSISGFSLSVLSQLGITLSNSGTLSLDESELESQLTSNFQDVAHLLLADGLDGEGNPTSLVPLLQSHLAGLTDSLDGPISHASGAVQQNIRRINQQIEGMESRIAVRREILIAQFSKADEALRQLSVLQTSLSGMMDSLSSL